MAPDDWRYPISEQPHKNRAVLPGKEGLTQNPPKSGGPTWGTDVLEILALSSFAISQPIFDLLKGNPGFLVARRTEPLDIVLLALGVSIIPAGVLIALEGLALLLSRSLQRFLHAFWLASLTCLILAPVLKDWHKLPGFALLTTEVVLGLVVALLYLRLRTRRVSLVFLSPALIIFPLLFFFHPSIHKLALGKRGSEIASAPSIGNPAPIVMVVFDEFPLTSLLNEKLEVNALRYPHFAELAKTATWYRNASAVSEGTLSAVPSILDGRYPVPALNLLPNAEDHPHSLFTLLGRSYQFHVLENDTRICPESLCGEGASAGSLVRQLRGMTSDLGVLYLHRILPPSLARKLPDISLSWKDFASKPESPKSLAAKLAYYEDNTDFSDRPGVFDNFIKSISVTRKPTLHYLHSLLPHAPWEFLPSGKQYTLDLIIRGLRGINDQGEDPNFWSGDPWLVVQSYQRHILQVQLADNLLGRLVEHLKTIGLYDTALLIIMGDHGCSFQPQDSRRGLTQTNWLDIMAIPLFIKSPLQKEGSVSDENVEAIDILPSIAEILQAEMPWKLDGQSISRLRATPKPHKLFVNEDGTRFTFEPSMAAMADAVKHKISLFGTGARPDQLFSIGTYGWLAGQKLTDLELTGVAPNHVTLDNHTYYDSVDFRSPYLPAGVSGQILTSKRSSPSPLHLAVAVNGTVQAVTRSFEQDKERRFSAVVPESALREGTNEVRVFAISEMSGKLILTELPRAGSTREYPSSGRIAFGRNGNAGSYQAEGWSSPDRDFTWIDGKRGTLALPAPPAGGSLHLQAAIMAHVVPGRIERQRIRVLVNRQLAGEWEIANRDMQEKTLVIPEKLVEGSEIMTITFEVPDAASPARLGTGPDLRELGLAVLWLQLTPGKGPA